MPRMTRWVGLMTALLLAGGADAASSPTVLSGVDVVAPAPMKTPPSPGLVEAYVGAIGVTSLTGQLATWSRTSLPAGPSGAAGAPTSSLAGETICPRILGLPEAHAAFILARIREVGGALGAPVSRKACPATANNVVIVFPDDAAAFIDKLAADKPQAFGFLYHGALVRDLAGPPRPIRAWYGVQTFTTEKTVSRISLPYRTVIIQVLIVVDRNKTASLNMGQLTDYLTMIALAQVQPDKVPPAAPSILNVFGDIEAGRAPAKGMTRMDAAYLQALYAIGPRQPGGLQNGQIADRLRRQLRSR